MASRKKKDTPLLPPEDLPKQTLFGWLRGRFFAGIVIAAPITISLSVVAWLITVIDARVKPLLPPLLKPETYTNIAIPGVGVVVAVIGLTLLGAVATNLIGRSLVGATERLLGRIPVVSNIYGAFKQLFDILGSSDQASFKEVVLVEYPKRGTWCIGFLTAKARGEVKTELGQEYVGVFVPTTPNPTSGFLMYVPSAEVKHLAMTVEEGAKMIISAGLVVPEHLSVIDGDDGVKPPPEALADRPAEPSPQAASEPGERAHEAS